MMQRAESKTASTVIGYSQKFGRIARGGKDKPVIINVDENGKVSIAMCETCFNRGIPDCDNVMAEPVYDPVTNKPADFSIFLYDVGDPSHPVWNGADWKDFVFLSRSEKWLQDRGLNSRGRAARHSLNDGNRDSRWASADRKALKAIKNLNDRVKFAVLDFFVEYDIVLAWIGISAILSAFVLALVGVIN